MDTSIQAGTQWLGSIPSRRYLVGAKLSMNQQTLYK